MFKAKDIIKICNGKLLCGDEETICKNFCNDTRKLNKGDVYVGIKGENFNGNSFYMDAINLGATVCILEEPPKTIDCNATIIQVDNSIKCLQELARNVINNFKGTVIAVTGSVGKTSTKDMIYSVVSTKYKTLRTIGNNNNHIGLPMTILKYTDEEVMILEMGMNNFGEISLLTNIAKPDIAVITNIGTAHIGILGSRENILKAKLEIIKGLKSNGLLIINNDNDLLHNYYLEHKLDNITTIGIENESNYMAKDTKYNENSSTFKVDNQEILVKVGSSPFVYNALIAYAIGKKLNIPEEMIKKGIENFTLTKNRLEIKENKKGVIIIDDTYNASYDSIKAAIETLNNRKEKRKIAVLGDILELGKYSEEIHKSLAKEIINSSIDILITVGTEMKYLINELIDNTYDKEMYSFDKYNDTYEVLDNILKKGDVVLLKASHGINLTEVVNHLMK